MASTEVADVASQLLRVVHERGPLDYEQLSAELGRDPHDPAWDDECADAVDGLGRIVELADERLADKVALLAGTTLTRRLTPAEVAGGYLELGADLQALTDLVEDSVPLAPGGRAAVELGKQPGRAETERLVGPAGWLGDAAAGDLVGLRLTDGLLHVEVRPSVGKAGPAGEAFAGAARARLETSELDPPRAGIIDALWQALADAPEAFRGVAPPLSELAVGEGLELTETMALPAGSGAADFPATSDVIHEGLAQFAYDADEAELVALRLARNVARRLELCRLLGEDVPDDELAAGADALTDPVALDVFLVETGDDPAAGLLGAAAAPVTTGPARAAACLLGARAAQADGDDLAAEAWLDQALEADPDLPPALTRAAELAEARGDAVKALRLLARAGWDDTDWAARLRDHASPGGTTGRNQPCPCGSGRKFKVCCGARPGGALPRRAGWLVDKLRAFAASGRAAARLRQRLAADARSVDWVEDTLGHPLVEDVVVFNLGLLEEFLAARGPLLPDDERDLAAAWRDTRRGVYRVDGVRGGEVTLSSRTDGSQVTARAVDGPPPRGELVLARVLPDGGGGWVLTAGALVEVEEHPAVARSVDPDADPLTVAEHWGADRPVLTTSEGEPLVACEWQATLDGDQAGRLADALRAAGLDEDEPGVFHETVDVDRHTRRRGTVTVAAEEVRVDTNAEARLARLVARVRDAVGELEPTVDRRTPMWRAVEDRRLYGVPEEPPEPSEEEVAALDELAREYEERWVDKAIPALNNLTPREARDHPTARASLEDLLADFDDQPGMMDPDRLRALLDLPVPDRRRVAAVSGEAGAGETSGPPAAGEERSARVAFACPPLSGRHEGLDASRLDPDDPDQRGLHVEAEHELGGAWDDDATHDPQADAGAHYAMHEVVASQLCDGDPPEAWATAQRLVADGYERHEVLHMLASAVAAEWWHAGRGERAFDVAAYLQRLDELPDSWELQREQGNRRPRGRRRRPSSGYGR